MALQRRLNLSLDPPKDFSKARIRADRSHIKRIMFNLIDNAIKYTDSGKIKVALQKESSNYLITVSDTGEGIAADKLEQVFEPFVRLSIISSGHGLGLSATKSLVRANNGEISVKSMEGEGSTFFIKFPVYLAVTADQAAS